VPTSRSAAETAASVMPSSAPAAGTPSTAGGFSSHPLAALRVPVRVGAAAAGRDEAMLTAAARFVGRDGARGEEVVSRPRVPATPPRQCACLKCLCLA